MAGLFLVALFLLKNPSLFKNIQNYQAVNQQANLTYNSSTIGELINKDTDQDGVPDWEEKLWGTDPTKKETTPGTPDGVAIEKLKLQTEQSGTGEPLPKGNEPLTQTDQFSRDLFATIAAATQDGQPLDQATIDKISSSLAEHIKNSAPRKVFLPADIKVIKDISKKAIQNYDATLVGIYQKNTTRYTVMDVLQKFEGDGNTVDVSALSLLDQNIKQLDSFINGMLKMETPQSLADLHLNVINGLERVEENLKDIKLYDTDIVVALSGASKYNQNATLLVSDTVKLSDAIKKN